MDRKIHYLPSKEQIFSWRIATGSHLSYDYDNFKPSVVEFFGFEITVWKGFNWEINVMTKLRLALVCLFYATWPEEFKVPDPTDTAAFAAAADYSDDPYLKLYVYLCLEFKDEVMCILPQTVNP